MKLKWGCCCFPVWFVLLFGTVFALILRLSSRFALFFRLPAPDLHQWYRLFYASCSQPPLGTMLQTFFMVHALDPHKMVDTGGMVRVAVVPVGRRDTVIALKAWTGIS